MVDESSNAPSLRGIDDRVLVDPEQVAAADAALQVLPLSHVCYLLTDLFPNVFDYHVVSGNIFHGIKAPIVNG